MLDDERRNLSAECRMMKTVRFSIHHSSFRIPRLLSGGFM